MKIYIYVDDIRSDKSFYQKHFSDEWNFIICRDYLETLKILNKIEQNDEVFIDLDHDLGINEIGEERNGYDICKYIINNNIRLIGFHVHTMNTVGFQNMRKTLINYGVKEYV